jgi:hypothetical protein
MADKVGGSFQFLFNPYLRFEILATLQVAPIIDHGTF